MPDSVQLASSIRTSSDSGGISNTSQLRWQPLRSLPVLERRQVGLERQLARQRLEWQQPRGGVRNLLHFSPAFLAGEFCFCNFNN